MATLTVTVAKGGEAGATFRKVAKAIRQVAADIPDANPTGASYVLTIDNAPATGTVSVQVTAGPITSSVVIV